MLPLAERLRANAQFQQVFREGRSFAEGPLVLNLRVADPAIRSWTSVCLKIVDDWFTRLSPDAQRAQVKQLEALLEAEGAAFDVAGHRDAPPGLRIWCGATVERGDVAALLPWLDWAYGEVRRAAAA